MQTFSFGKAIWLMHGVMEYVKKVLTHKFAVPAKEDTNRNCLLKIAEGLNRKQHRGLLVI